MSKGTTYVAIVVAALAGYFVYQTWFNPSRVVKRRLGEIAAALSIPDTESEFDRLARLAHLRKYLATDVHVRADGVDVDSSGAIVGMLSAVRPPKGGVDIQFVDVQLAVDSETTAHAGLMTEVNTHDPQTGEWLADQFETTVSLEKRNAEWVVVKGEIKNRPRQ